MSLFDFGNFAVKGENVVNGISFEGLGKKWGNEGEGRSLLYFDVFNLNQASPQINPKI